MLMPVYLFIGDLAGKNPPDVQNSFDFSKSFPFALGITIFLVLISFSLGAVASWLFVSRWKQGNIFPELRGSSLTQQNTYQIFARGVAPSSQRTASHAPRSPEGRDEAFMPSQPAPEEPFKNERWLRLVEECVGIFDELDRIAPNVDAARQEMIRHIRYRLQEVLTRSGVEMISQDTVYDRGRHQLEPANPDVAPGTLITEIVTPGFAVGRRVLRPARVHVAVPPM